MSDDPHLEQGKGLFDREKAGDIVHRQFQDHALPIGKSPIDGLPTMVTQNLDDAAPPLTHDHFVCIADERMFVIRNYWGETLVEFSPEEVHRSPVGFFYVTLQELFDKAGSEVLFVESVKMRMTILNSVEAMGRLNRDPSDRIAVTPARERCRYLVEMMMGMEGDSEHVAVHRMCSLRHDEAGDLLSLRDEMVVACSGRNPSDLVSADRLRRFNNRTIARGEERVARGGIFDVDAFDAPDELEGVVD